MLILLLATVLAQGSMFGTPKADPPAPPPDRTAAVIERMAADRHDTMAELTKLHEEIAGLKQQIAAAASAPAPEPRVITLPAPPPPPAQKVYVARDVSGFNWGDTDQDRLLDWVEQQNIRKRGVVRPASVQVTVSPPSVRTYTMPTYVMPQATAAPAYTYAPAMRLGTARVCIPGVGCSP